MKTYALIQDGKVYEVISPVTWSTDAVIVTPAPEPENEDDEPGEPITTIVHHAGDEVDISDRFPPEYVALCVVVPDDLVDTIVQGWTYNGTTFAAPVQVPPPAVDYVTPNAAQQVALMTTANAVTFGMGDAYIAGLLDDADTVKFKAWAAYKLALSKVDLTQAQPAWPTVPA